jgi:hypothetical protein
MLNLLLLKTSKEKGIDPMLAGVQVGARGVVQVKWAGRNKYTKPVKVSAVSAGALCGGLKSIQAKISAPLFLKVQLLRSVGVVMAGGEGVGSAAGEGVGSAAG